MQNPRTRTIAVAVAGVAGALLLAISANTGVTAGVAVLAMIVGLLLFVGVGVVLLRYYRPGHDVPSDDEVDVGQWTFWRFWLHARAAAPLYLGIRLYVGYVWLTSGWGKVQNPAWVQTGEALKGFWEKSLTTQGEIVYPAYRALIQFMYDNAWYTWMGKVIPLGELLIGLGFSLAD